MLTLGPKFVPDTPDLAIAADFATGLDVLVRNNYLSADSVLIRELRSKLKTFISQAISSADVPAGSATKFSAKTNASPATLFEGQILTAFRVSVESY